MVPAPKQPDYCTLFPDRLAGKDWSNCCMAHDTAYGTAGSRLAADHELAKCVAQETGWDGLAVIMFAGVATFGWLFRTRIKKTIPGMKPARKT